MNEEYNVTCSTCKYYYKTFNSKVFGQFGICDKMVFELPIQSDTKACGEYKLADDDEYEYEVEYINDCHD